MEVWLSLGVCIVGLVVYGLSSTGKPQEVGRLMFACGLLAFLLGSKYLVQFFKG